MKKTISVLCSIGLLLGLVCFATFTGVSAELAPGDINVADEATAYKVTASDFSANDSGWVVGGFNGYQGGPTDGVLTVKPRLPWHWDSLQVENYPVVDTDGTVHRISLTYRHDRCARNCRVTVENADGLTRLAVRFGPFPRLAQTKNDMSAFRKVVRERATFFETEIQAATEAVLQL